MVDGESKGVVSSYTFTNVTADHTISASFNPAAVSFAVTTENLGTETASTAFSVTITAKDIEGNTATGYTGSHNIIWSWTASNSPESTEPTKPADGDQTFSNGAVTVTGFILTNSSETTAITATANGAAGTTPDITVNAGALNKFTFANIGEQQKSVSFYIIITAKDAVNNTVTSYAGTGTLTASTGTGTISPISTGVFTSGVWAGDVTITDKGDPVVIEIVDNGITGKSNDFKVKN